MAWGSSDYTRKDQENLHKLDGMVTIAKDSLEEIVKITSKKEGVININQIQAIALAALLNIERKGK